MYKNLNDEANESAGGRHVRSTDLDEGENFITDVDKVAIEQSDIITTFLNKSKAYFIWHGRQYSQVRFSCYSIGNHITEVRHERGRKLWFDISEVASDSTLMMAELRIFQNPALGRWQDINKEFIINVYFLTDSEK